MSGDVQPKRRRDRKRKKEEQLEETTVAQQPQAPVTPTVLTNDDITIHVHIETSLGGGVCAKCVFFVLMIVISVVIGITITAHRGQTDIDIPASESRFASIFEGWIDKNLKTHDDDDLHTNSEHVSHEDEEDIVEYEASEEHGDDEDEEEETASDEEAEAEDSEPEVSEEEEDVSEQEEEEEEDDEEESVQEDEESQEDYGVDQADDESQENEDKSESQEDADAEAEETEEDIVAEESEPDEQENSNEQTVSDEENDEKEDVHSEEAEESEEEIYNKNDESPSQTEGIQDIEEDDQNDDDDDNYIPDVDNAEISTANSVKSGTKGDAESDSDNDQHIGVTKRTRSGAQSAYAYENITNADDYVIRNELDQAQRHLVDNVQLALNLFTQILENHPNSPRALYGKAQALDLWAEEKQSNVILQTSIHAYVQVLNAYGAVPDSLFLLAGERCINRMRFIGNYARAIYIHKILIDRFPNDVKYRNELAVTYLTTNKIDEARIVLMDILERWPNDGFALVHYGFILKTVDNKLNDAIEYLRRGIETKETGVIDGRFYFHLGDALTRLGKKDEAMKVYEDGVANKVFLSKYQRSLYNVERLSARPWWNKKHTPYASLYKKLEQHFTEIRDEALAILNKKGYFKDESENLRDVGDWKQFELYARGVKNAENCRRSPVTCSIVESEPDVKGCKRGQVKFSVMHPGTHVWPHCGPTNCRLRIHLGLKVPEKTYIRVAEETRSWEEGKIFIFDDSFEHEVWHNGTKFRLVLIIDIWHPDLTKAEKHRLSAI